MSTEIYKAINLLEKAGKQKEDNYSNYEKQKDRIAQQLLDDVKANTAKMLVALLTSA